MRDPSLLGPWVRRFLQEHLVGERNLSRNTQHSYRLPGYRGVHFQNAVKQL